MKGELKVEKTFLHSRCCESHWELVTNENGEYDLECASCGESIGSNIHVIGPELENCECEECKKNRRDN